METVVIPSIIRASAALALMALVAACDRPASDAGTAAEETATADPQAGSGASTEAVESTHEIPPVPEPGFDTQRFVADMRTLASDEFEGRAPGSRGERLTVDHLV
jgi:hypothetical protein